MCYVLCYDHGKTRNIIKDAAIKQTNPGTKYLIGLTLQSSSIGASRTARPGTVKKLLTFAGSSINLSVSVDMTDLMKSG